MIVDENSNDVSIPPKNLRWQAERTARENMDHPRENLETMLPEEIGQIFHELRVHQIELEMQNEELRQTQIELDAQRERYFDLYDLAPVGYCTLSEEGFILEANLTAAILLGITQSKLVGRLMSGFVHKEDQNNYYLYRKNFFRSDEKSSFELRLLRENNPPFWAHIMTTAAKNSDNISIVRLVMSDITEKKIYENELNRITQYDALTNLPNRVLLSDRLSQGMAQSQRHGLPLAVVYLDLDGFKEINDTHSHEVGDHVLITLSDQMKQTLREGDTLARIGGDEFVIILLDLKTIEDAIPMIIHLLDATSTPINVDHLLLQITASLGVTFYPQAQNIDTDLLLRQADQAMYQAKLAGRNRYHVFDTQQDTILRERYEFIETIRKAMQSSEFLLYYQPKVNMRTGAIIGVEALIRWQHPENGLLQPAMFLPMIEDHPLSIELGEWVINTALTQMELWQNQGLDIHVSVNVSARQLQENNFVNRLQEILAIHPKINPAHLDLEVLETSKLEDMNRTAQIIQSCREFNVLFSLDDFGTGYSSLTYLQRLPIATIKIDQSFIRDMFNNTNDIAILSGIISLATAFHLNIIAEGVETIEHGELLLKMGCEYAQGYAIARPMPASELPHWSATWHSHSEWINQLVFE
ncbi:MAG: EAL domain-containing protein [Campylobacterales bacterium]|nr:EAL domain-containing protein [Campylobacterales bacterium]